MPKTEWPAWFYGPDGERKVFQGPDEVPEGWQDSPRPKVSGDLNNDGIVEPSKAEIIKTLRERKVAFDARWSIARLSALL